MAKIFRREEPDTPGLRAFFLGWKAINPQTLAAAADSFLRVLTAPQEPGDVLAELVEVFPERGTRPLKETALSFLEELGARLLPLVRGGQLDVLEEWRDALREAQFRVEVLNMSAPTVAESLFHRMRAALAAESGS